MTKEQRPNQYYDLVDPKTGIVYKPNPQRVWAYVKESMDKLIKENRIYFPNNPKQKPMYKRFKSELKVVVNPISTWINENSKLVDSNEVTQLYSGLNSEGTKVIQNLFENRIFDYPKPISLLISIINQCTKKDDIILDFFSGSATTAHAVMQLNAEDGGKRKFIMVQLPEKTDEKSDAYKAGYENICEIGKERIRRAGEKIVQETGKTDLDIGFKVFKLDSSNVKTWDPDFDNLEQTLFDLQDNIKEDRTKEDLLYEILLKIGLPLTTPIEEIDYNGKTIYNVAYGSVLVCLEDDIDLDIVQEMLKYQSEHMPPKVIFKESGFISDAVKTNAIQTLKKHGITDVRSV
nr:DNA methyltransferase [Parageobacillus galactosidasius]